MYNKEQTLLTRWCTGKRAYPYIGHLCDGYAYVNVQLAVNIHAHALTRWLVRRLSTCFLNNACQNSLQINLIISRVSPSRGLSLVYLGSAESEEDLCTSKEMLCFLLAHLSASWRPTRTPTASNAAAAAGPVCFSPNILTDSIASSSKQTSAQRRVGRFDCC